MSSEPKPRRGKKPAEASLLRSSAAEYLTFVAASGQGGVEAVYADENVWLTQKMMGLLYDVETHTINYHLKKVFSDSELVEDSVIRIFRITAADGKEHKRDEKAQSEVVWHLSCALIHAEMRQPIRHGFHRWFDHLASLASKGSKASAKRCPKAC